MAVQVEPGLAARLALLPALAVTLVAFLGAIVWTIWMSFTKSRRFPDYAIDPGEWSASTSGCSATTPGRPRCGTWSCWRSAARSPSCFGFVLAAMIESEQRGEGFFRTIFLYPLAVSFIVTGIVWRWMFNPALGIENFLHRLGWESANFNWLADPRQRCTASSSPRSGTGSASTWR